MLENRQLAYFLAVAREGNITAAAEYLHMTQPALSRQMKDLERQLGCTLFERGRGITLTDEGRLLQRRAAEMLELMELTEGSFSGQGAQIAGEVSVGCGESRGMDLLADAMAAVHAEHPGVTFRVFSGDANAVMERMDKGLVDVGLLLGHCYDSRYEAWRLPVDERFGLVVPTDDPAAQTGAATADDLRRLPLILPSQAAGSYDLTMVVGTPEDDLHVVAHYSLISNALKLQRAGLGCVLGLESPALPLVPDGFAFVPLADATPVPNYVVTKRGQAFSPATRVFIEALREASGHSDGQ